LSPRGFFAGRFAARPLWALLPGRGPAAAPSATQLRKTRSKRRPRDARAAGYSGWKARDVSPSSQRDPGRPIALLQAQARTPCRGDLDNDRPEGLEDHAHPKLLSAAPAGRHFRAAGGRPGIQHRQAVARQPAHLGLRERAARFIDVYFRRPRLRRPARSEPSSSAPSRTQDAEIIQAVKDGPGERVRGLGVSFAALTKRRPSRWPPAFHEGAGNALDEGMAQEHGRPGAPAYQRARAAASRPGALHGTKSNRQRLGAPARSCSGGRRGATPAHIGPAARGSIPGRSCSGGVRWPAPCPAPTGRDQPPVLTRSSSPTGGGGGGVLRRADGRAGLSGLKAGPGAVGLGDLERRQGALPNWTCFRLCTNGPTSGRRRACNRRPLAPSLSAPYVAYTGRAGPRRAVLV